jgi:hypothetical protein
MKLILSVLLFASFGVFTTNAANDLLYFEGQGIVGYSSMDNGAIYHSGHRYDAMQKNGVGFDYIKKFSREYGNIGTGALQMRLVWNNADNRPQLQVYNAYLKSKTSPVDVWAGHNRIPFGLASYWDTHADLLQPLSMFGFGFDRDWGAGISKDFANGDFSTAITTGSGMRLETKGSWLMTSRASYGVLARDNYSVGASFMGGEILDTMGYEVIDNNLKNILLGGIDLAYNHGRVEHKAEFNYGQKNDMSTAAAFYRMGFNFLEEYRLKIEGQYTWTKQEDVSNISLGLGATYKINSDFTARAMCQWEQEMNNNRIIFQLYRYSRI